MAKNTLAMVPKAVPTTPPNSPAMGAARRVDTFQCGSGRAVAHSE